MVWRQDTAQLGSLELWENNPKRMSKKQATRLLASWKETGQFQTLAVGPNGECYDGHQRVKTLIAAGYPANYEIFVLRSNRPLTEEERRSIILHSTMDVGSFDWSAMAGWESAGWLDGFGFDAETLSEWNDSAANLRTMLVAEQDDDEELDAVDKPGDFIFPSDNEWGVPSLNLSGQALTVDLPVNVWGAAGRKNKMRGTYHFYTDDYRFDGLWTDPSPVVNSGCINAVEPNISTNLQMPRAVVLWHTYRKRWMSRYWQDNGVKIFVDLDVHPDLQDINLLGVPSGWRSYACYMRQSDHKDEEIYTFCETARARCGGDNFLLLVIGGNKNVQKMASEIPQVVWVASFEQKFYRNYKPGGGG